jgi:hypothetical protein
VKVVADTLGVARSNLVEQVRGSSKRRGRYQRQGDDELMAAIRQLTDARPTYGYRRIRRCSTGLVGPPVSLPSTTSGSSA